MSRRREATEEDHDSRIVDRIQAFKFKGAGGSNLGTWLRGFRVEPGGKEKLRRELRPEYFMTIWQCSTSGILSWLFRENCVQFIVIIRDNQLIFRKINNKKCIPDSSDRTSKGIP